MERLHHTNTARYLGYILFMPAMWMVIQPVARGADLNGVFSDSNIVFFTKGNYRDLEPKG